MYKLAASISHIKIIYSVLLLLLVVVVVVIVVVVAVFEYFFSHQNKSSLTELLSLPLSLALSWCTGNVDLSSDFQRICPLGTIFRIFKFFK